MIAMRFDPTRAWLLAVALATALAASSDTPGPDFRVAELEPGVLVVTSKPWHANTLLVKTNQGIILVDTPATPADTARLLDWVEHRWGQPVTHALASHWHADGSGGNQVLEARGAELVSSQKTAELLRERGNRAAVELAEMYRESSPETSKEFEEIRATPARRTFQVPGVARFELAGEPVELHWVAPSHTPDSVGVYFPNRGLLYGGCIVRSDGQIINRNELDAEGWIAMLDVFLGLETRFVIPGHGQRFDPTMLSESKQAVETLGSE